VKLLVAGMGDSGTTACVKGIMLLPLWCVRPCPAVQARAAERPSVPRAGPVRGKRQARPLFAKMARPNKNDGVDSVVLEILAEGEMSSQQIRARLVHRGHYLTIWSLHALMRQILDTGRIEYRINRKFGIDGYKEKRYRLKS
jgi:hypothetical protein